MQYTLPPMQAMTYAGIGTIVLGVLLLAGLVRGSRGPLNYIAGSIICIALGIFLLSIRSTGVITVETGNLALKAPLLKTRIITQDGITRAWVQDLSESEWFPAKKLNGAAAGSLRSGEFRLRNGRRAFLVLEGERALCIEDTEGKLYLLGTAEFEPFLSELRTRLPRLAEKIE